MKSFPPPNIDIEFIKKNHIIEICVLIILAVITIFRKKLSSNNKYRSNNENAVPVSKSNCNNNLNNKLGIMINNHKMDKRYIFKSTASSNINNLSIDLIVNLVGYLETHEIVQLMCSSKQLLNDIRSDTIWEQLWIQTYGYMWQSEAIKKIREQKNIYWGYDYYYYFIA